jgi:hypothetical protein
MDIIALIFILGFFVGNRITAAYYQGRIKEIKNLKKAR